MLGAIMYMTKYLMQILPNIHLLALFITAFTLTYKAKALIPLYVYVMLDGIMAGFAVWWIPYLYIWFLLWGAVMLVSRIKMPKSVAVPVYMLLCGLHGLSFGTLCAPIQAIMYNYSIKTMLAWIVAGIPFDIVHAVSNFCAGSLVMPLNALLVKLDGAIR